MTGRFAPDWLYLREHFDHQARSISLAQQLLPLLPARPRLLDLGAGTGSLFRWLAPVIAGPQSWILVDADPALLERAFADCADWARARGWTVTWPHRAMLVHTPGGAWRAEALQVDLPDVDALPLGRADAVLCSALLDQVSLPWLAALVARLQTPLLACLTADGHEQYLPAHPGDMLLRRGLRRDQGRDKGFGPALGAAATAALLRLLQAGGFHLRSASTPWRVSRGELAMLRALVEGRAEAAIEALPSQALLIDDWRRDRLRQALAMRLAIRVRHRDILAIPEGKVVA
jgi:SAM-dependent methyltransferase